jgi:hypothetical protein
MWYKVNIESWEDIIQDLKLSIFYRTKFLNTTAKVFEANVDCYIFKKKEKILAVGAFYVKDKKIITPESFSFTALWFSPLLSDINYINCAEYLINSLKYSYSNITLKLTPEINDIRPFIWANFTIENKYTYIKKDTLPAHYSIVKNLSKLPQEYYSFIVNPIDDTSLELNSKFLRNLGFSKSLINYYRLLILSWDSIGIVKAFNLYKQNKLICSNIVIIDESKIYTILLNNVSGEDKYAHSYLYTEIIHWCKQNGILEIDFCGANLPSVAKFKSYFNADLVPYFVLSFSPSRVKMYRIIKYIKDRIKTSLRR